MRCVPSTSFPINSRLCLRNFLWPVVTVAMCFPEMSRSRSVRTQLPSKPERVRIGWALIPGSGCKPGNELVLWQLTVHVWPPVLSSSSVLLPPCCCFLLFWFLFFLNRTVLKLTFRVFNQTLWTKPAPRIYSYDVFLLSISLNLQNPLVSA